MLIQFFHTLRAAGLPVSVGEFLSLLQALRSGVLEGDDALGSGPSVDKLYHLARTVLVKDESLFDRFDRAFAAYFHAVGAEAAALQERTLPADWLRHMLTLELSPEQRAAIEKMDWDELMRTLRERLEQQRARHQGGSRMIGTAGTSPFGAWGFNPQGIRIGQDTSRERSAVKVWDQRHYRDYDAQRELGTRQLKVALRRLRRFAREGAAEELDLPDTIRSTAARAGLLDIKLVPERRNRVKLLLLMDVGGTMDEHVQRVEELFSAARSEFKHMAFYYFHNCVYEQVWKDNHRRRSERTDTAELLRTYDREWRLVFVGDATMSPYEILQRGGSVEHHNEEPGAVWLQRLVQAYPRSVWINPEPAGVWPYRQSIALVQQILGQRMHPLTLAGLDGAMRWLSK